MMTNNRAILGTEISKKRICSFELYVFDNRVRLYVLLNLAAKEEMFSSDLSIQPS